VAAAVPFAPLRQEMKQGAVPQTAADVEVDE
jgi:hypothetical protein